MRVFHAGLCLTVALTAGGCVEQTLSIQSNPPGSMVYLNGQEIGRTPLEHDFDAYGNYDVAVRKEGYETLKTARRLKTPFYMLPPLDLAMEILPLGIRDHRNWTFDLQPTSAEQVDPSVLLERADEMRGALRPSRRSR